VYGYGYGPEQHPQAVLALVLGIIGLPFICFIFSIPAVIIGWKVHTEVKGRTDPVDRGQDGSGRVRHGLGVDRAVVAQDRRSDRPLRHGIVRTGRSSLGQGVGPAG